MNDLAFVARAVVAARRRDRHLGLRRLGRGAARPDPPREHADLDLLYPAETGRASTPDLDWVEAERLPWKRAFASKASSSSCSSSARRARLVTRSRCGRLADDHGRTALRRADRSPRRASASSPRRAAGSERSSPTLLTSARGGGLRAVRSLSTGERASCDRSVACVWRRSSDTCQTPPVAARLTFAADGDGAGHSCCGDAEAALTRPRTSSAGSSAGCAIRCRQVAPRAHRAARGRGVRPGRRRVVGAARGGAAPRRRRRARDGRAGPPARGAAGARPS